MAGSAVAGADCARENGGSDRRIRSFVRRPGRITAAQRRALERLWPRYGLDPGPGTLDLDAVFGRRADRVLEIGFGMGDALVEAARTHPQRDHLGIDVYEPGIGRTLHRIDALGLDNVRLLRGDAVDLLDAHLAPRCLAGVMLFFPDPWPKKRHHKRRLVQPGFARLVADRLAPGGRLELATDWEDYARHMLAVLEGCRELRNLAGPGSFAARPPSRPATKFERRGERLGHAVFDLAFERR